MFYREEMLQSLGETCSKNAILPTQTRPLCFPI